MSATSLGNTTQTQSGTQFLRYATLTLRVVTAGMGLVAIAAFVIYLVAALNWQSLPFPGFLTTYTGTINAGRPVSTAGWPALENGLQRNDRLLTVAGESVEVADPVPGAFTDLYQGVLSTLAVGETVEITVERPAGAPNSDAANCTPEADGGAICTASLTLTRFPDGDFLAYFIIPALTGAFLFVIGGALLALRSQTVEGSLGTLLAFTSVINVMGLFDVGTTHQLTPLWLVATLMLSATLISLGMVFPMRLRAVYRTPALPYLPLVGSGLLAIYFVYWYHNPASVWDHTMTQVAALLTLLALVALIVLLGLFQRPIAVTARVRDQVGTVLIGTALMLVPAALWGVGLLLSQVAPLQSTVNFETLTPLYIFPNLAIAYAMLQSRRFGAESFVSQGITYLIMLGALITGIFLLTLGGTLFLQETFAADDPVFIALILFGMVLFFTPLRNSLQQRIDRIYFRERRNFQQRAEDFSQTLTLLRDYDEIAGAFYQELDATVVPVAAFIFRLDSDSSMYSAYQGRTAEASWPRTDVRFSVEGALATMLNTADDPIVLQPGYPFPHALRTEQPRLQLLRAYAVMPLHGQNRLNGFVVLAPPRSGKQSYTHEELRHITNIVGHLSIATERSQVITSLERRVSELDVLGQVSQAVNYTLPIDSLLELVYTQATRLIESQAYYFAFYDTETDEMHFVFYQEGEGDRDSEKETLRWPLGSDLFSEVARDARPLRVETFSAEMLRRGALNTLISPDVRAWMGVPLGTRDRMRGVMAAGKMNQPDTFTDEQFKVFQDIGALAAASLEKANLFNETRLRERQLTVLNDISRQLVAAETNVERLLELITASAVEILGAEAGSLFLYPESSSQELEFRVVIGGGGSDLIGKRIPAGTGIVGQVATSGQPLTVNNAENDARRTETTAIEQSTNLMATNILAVPLKAKDSVIGVLEVLNKRDGTLWRDSDSDLLITFASQAAIAIENARLLEMQDIQLTERVRELETLERIDRDLNRTLDLHEVARITVESAMRTLNATAGALGIVRQSPPYLEIVAIQGYSPDEYPAGAEGVDKRIWPLDQGIVGRVMRTRQADLAPDLSIDPNYSGGLKGSLCQITLPMMAGDDINAILILEKNEEPRFGLANSYFAQRIAEHASIAIANAQFHEALTVSNKSKSDFMGFAAHELKTPLTSIKGYTEVLLTGMTGELSEQQRSFVDTIQSNAKRMETLISDLRDSAKIDANEFRVELAPTNLRSTIIETLRPLLSALEDRDQVLVNAVPDDLPLVMGDETRLIQVFTNLITNANKYSPPGKTITIRAEVVENYVSARGKSLGPMVQVAVVDQGFGMSDEELARLFRERYFRSDREQIQEQSGTGLGMMLTHGIIEKHNGDIRVESEINVGSTFFVALPLATEEAVAKHSRNGKLSSD